MDAGTPSARAIPGEYIIGFNPTATPAQRAKALIGIAPTKSEPLDFIDGAYVTLPEGKTLSKDTFTGVAADVVQWVQPNMEQHVREAALPNDTDYAKQYAHNNTGQTGGTADADINVPEAWLKTRGSKDVIVAVVDTNVDITHPELAPNIWKNTKEVLGNKVDDDKNGFVDDVNGWNFGQNSPDVTAGGQSHGTHVSGIIAAVADNAKGVAGIAPNVQVMPVPILTGGSSTANAIKGFEYAVKNGANILSNSWGNNTYEPALAAAVAKATKEGALVVVASGNENWDTGVNGSYPDNYAGSVSIAASDDNDAKASYSNRSTVTIDVAAPGDEIYSTLPRGGFGNMSGTSMAAPAYSAAAALVKSAYPNLTMKQVEERLNKSVRKDGSAAQWNKLVASGGRIDVAAALTPLATPASPTPSSAPVAGKPSTIAWKSDITDAQAFDVEVSTNADATSAVEESFEGDAPKRAFSSNGDKQWAIAQGDAKTGARAFTAGGLTRGGQSRLELVETVNEATPFSFAYKATGRSNELSFFIDRDLQFQPAASTGTDWREFSTTLEPGEHRFTWLATSKGGSTKTDVVSVDDVKIGKVSDAAWRPVGSTKPGETSLPWTPDRAAGTAQARVRASNGKFAGQWVSGERFGISEK